MWLPSRNDENETHYRRKVTIFYSKLLTATLLTTAIALPACSSDQKAPKTGATSFTNWKSSGAQQGESDDVLAQQPNVRIADDIRTACAAAKTDIKDEVDAQFAYDSAKVKQSDRVVLKSLANCLKRGALDGKKLVIVGHADPRGSAEYNYLLGERRAWGVKRFLVSEGVKASRLDTSSRGEIEADGVDPESWEQDRRVDVILAQ